MTRNRSHISSTVEPAYAESLVRKQTVWWKRLLDVQAPYRWNLRRIRPGYTFEIGCGIGRNLDSLGGAGVGIDHNLASVQIARSRGFIAYTPAEFSQNKLNVPASFDTLLVAHVLEHMTRLEAVELIRKYLGLLRPGGQIVLITPQEAGFQSDPSHREFMDFQAHDKIQRELGTLHCSQYSFPLPRAFGKLFKYNEFVSVGKRRW